MQARAGLMRAAEILGGADLARLQAAQARVSPHVRCTPMVRSQALTARQGAEVWLKFEHHQDTGAFKLRGATHALACLAPEALARGVVTASTGNHGRALALAAQRLGAHATVCMSDLVPENKVQAVRELGAEVAIVGHSQDDAQVQAREWVASRGLTYVPPFDHPDVILGQATLGLEVVAQCPEVATVVVPLSGGGLAAGVALAVKTLRPRARVIGVSMVKGAAMAASLEFGRPVDVLEQPTLADSLGGGIGLDNRYSFALVQALVDEVVLLDEAAIARGMVHVHRHQHEVVEGAAAVGVAAVLEGRLQSAAPGPMVLLLTGRNVDPRVHRDLVARAVEEDA